MRLCTHEPCDESTAKSICCDDCEKQNDCAGRCDEGHEGCEYLIDTGASDGKITNGEAIRKMDDDKLAKFLGRSTPYYCKVCPAFEVCRRTDTCESAILHWLLLPEKNVAGGGQNGDN